MLQFWRVLHVRGLYLVGEHSLCFVLLLEKTNVWIWQWMGNLSPASTCHTSTCYYNWYGLLMNLVSFSSPKKIVTLHVMVNWISSFSCLQILFQDIFWWHRGWSCLWSSQRWQCCFTDFRWQSGGQSRESGLLSAQKFLPFLRRKLYF